MVSSINNFNLKLQLKHAAFFIIFGIDLKEFPVVCKIITKGKVGLSEYSEFICKLKIK